MPLTLDHDADAIVVGAGPGGSAAAYHLAQTGRDVLLLEKSSFPREKVCGDGLTPRGVKSVIDMGIDTSPEAGWVRNKGLRVYGGGVRIELDWPELGSWPDYGLVRPRLDFDEILARQAQKAGARLHEATTVTGPVLDGTGRVTGVTAKGSDGVELTFRAPVVIAADGNSSRLSLALGLTRRTDRPLGVAVRRYYKSPRSDDNYLESWLELWDGKPEESRLLPGYGWIFGLGDGRANIGLGILNTSEAFGHVDYRSMLDAWGSSLPPEWQITEEYADGPTRGAALPMGFNRTPHYIRGVLLVGDAGGTVNPFNGEGIAYAMESGKMAAEIVHHALDRAPGAARERALAAYPKALQDRYGGYYTLGRAFSKMIGNPKVMQFTTRKALPHPTLMRFLLKLLANLTDPSGGDAHDRIVNALSRIAPATR